MYMVKKSAVAVILAFSLFGCACLTYETPDGTRVTYKRFMTGADTIKGQVGSAKIETQGQKTLDPALLEILVKALGAAK